MYSIEESACDVVGTFRRPGNCPPLVTPLDLGAVEGSLATKGLKNHWFMWTAKARWDGSFLALQDIELKSLLYEACSKGSHELLYVVPFVAKVLESVGKGKVFKLPNPWTESIISVLVELHMEQDLKVCVSLSMLNKLEIFAILIQSVISIE